MSALAAAGTVARPGDAPGAAPPLLVLEHLTRRFGGTVAVDALSLTVARGELLALLGASGSGKTTTLRMIAGYETPDAGRVWLARAGAHSPGAWRSGASNVLVAQDAGGGDAPELRDITRLPPERRDFGTVFQHYALFPHLNAGENVAFGLEARGVRRAERARRAAAALETVGLAGASARAVQSLSGGEQQRVALARALVIEPQLLLLDEPLSNLDPLLRRATRGELRATLHRLGVTAVLVTHDQEDAFAVADRVALLERGRLLQVGTPEMLYDRPASRAVAEFIGEGTLLPAAYDGRLVRITVGERTQVTEAVAPAGLAPGAVLAVLRPGALELSALEPNAPEPNALDPNALEVDTRAPSARTVGASEYGDMWPGVVAVRRFAGALTAYAVALDRGATVEVHGARRDLGEGSRVGVRVARAPVAVVAP